jgi:hypothetical protein
MSEEHDGPTVNGRPLLTREEVRQWSRDVHAPLTAAGAKRIAAELNRAALEALIFLTRKQWPATKRLAEVSADLTRLRANMSAMVADTRLIQRHADTSVTDKLLDGIDRHAPLIRAKSKGRPIEPSATLTHNIGDLFRSIRAEEGEERKTTDTAANGFAERAAQWVLDDPLVVRAGKVVVSKASSIGRQNRRMRTKSR